MKAKLIIYTLVVCYLFIAGCKKDLKDNILNDNLQEQILSKSNKKIGNINFNPENFSNSTLLANKYFSYQIGKKYIFEGKTADGLERNIIQRIAVDKLVMGIHVAVISDKVWLDGELEEDTRDWFAQDDQGNVWYMGEEVDNYDDGTISDHDGSWEAGLNGAIAGINMLADPRPGISYRQEFAAGIAEDEAKVVAMGITVKVPFDTYTNCLKTKEWTDLEKGDIGFKFYAPGIGLVKEKIRNELSELVAIQ